MSFYLGFGDERRKRCVGHGKDSSYIQLGMDVRRTQITCSVCLHGGEPQTANSPFAEFQQGMSKLATERTGRGVDALPPDDTDEPLAILFTF